VTDDVCAVPDCGQPAARHLSVPEARRAFEQLPEKGRSAPLCKAHYKEWKKATKKDRTLERLGR
jgi:thymidine kinase